MKGIVFNSSLLLSLLVFLVALGGVSAVVAASLDPDVPVGHFEKVEGLMNVENIEDVPLVLPHWASLYMGSTAIRQHQHTGSGLIMGAMADGDCAAVLVGPGLHPQGTATCSEDVHVGEGPSCPDGQMLTGFSPTGVAQCQEDPDRRVPRNCVGDGIDTTILADGTVLCTTRAPHHHKN